MRIISPFSMVTLQQLPVCRLLSPVGYSYRFSLSHRDGPVATGVGYILNWAIDAFNSFNQRTFIHSVLFHLTGPIFCLSLLFKNGSYHVRATAPPPPLLVNLGLCQPFWNSCMRGIGLAVNSALKYNAAIN